MFVNIIIGILLACASYTPGSAAGKQKPVQREGGCCGRSSRRDFQAARSKPRSSPQLSSATGTILVQEDVKQWWGISSGVDNDPRNVQIEGLFAVTFSPFESVS